MRAGSWLHEENLSALGKLSKMMRIIWYNLKSMKTWAGILLFSILGIAAGPIHYFCKDQQTTHTHACCPSANILPLTLSKGSCCSVQASSTLPNGLGQPKVELIAFAITAPLPSPRFHKFAVEYRRDHQT